MASKSWVVLHSAGLVSEYAVKVWQIVVTFTTVPSGSVELLNGTTDESARLMSINLGFGGTINVPLTEGVNFSAGLYVDMPAECDMVALLLEREDV